MCAFQHIHEHVSVRWNDYTSELKQILSINAQKPVFIRQEFFELPTCVVEAASRSLIDRNTLPNCRLAAEK